MKTKDKGGRPAHAPDDRSRQMVEVLSGFGIPQDKIADVIGVDGKTLRKHYTTELQRGAATVEAKLVGNLLKLASGSDGTALKAIMFALQCAVRQYEIAWRSTASAGKFDLSSRTGKTHFPDADFFAAGKKICP